MSLFWNTAAYLLGLGGGASSSVFYETAGNYDKELEAKMGADVEPNNISAVYTAIDTIASSLSLMPLEVQKEGREDRKHELFYQVRHRLCNLYNNQVILSTLENQRNVYGNSFLDIRKKSFGEIIPPYIVDDWDFKGIGNTVRYHLNWPSDGNGGDKRDGTRAAEWIESKDVCHFKSMSSDGVMGLPKMMSIAHSMSITNKATLAVESFYKNGAMSKIAIEQTLPDTNKAASAIIEQTNRFREKNAGAKNWGKEIWLPPNTKMTPLQLSMIDSELIATLNWSENTIFNMFHIPQFMRSNAGSVQMDIEQQTLYFKQFTISPIAKVYEEELKFKLMKKEDVMKGYDIGFDYTALVSADLSALSKSHAQLIQSGISSPYQSSLALGFEPSKDPSAKLHYSQSQLVPLGQNPSINNNGGNEKIGENKIDKKKVDTSKKEESTE